MPKHSHKMPSKRCVSQSDTEALASVASYLDHHYPFNPRLDFLAKSACMSPAKLKYSFKAIYHCSVKQYMQSRRIDHAEKLLLSSTLKIGQIARAVGYKNQGSFSELFKKHTGLSPVEYRRQVRRK
ncbi:MAG: helix-turn-helix domain-containing protein [Anaerovoracaceae bacterium]|jgi:AraC-like DNA-binding protein